MLWIVACITFLFLVRYLWKIYNHPSNVMTRQAAHMNWVVTGRVKCDSGGHDLLLFRNGYTARIAWRNGRPTLVDPPTLDHFNSFIAIEHWICQAEQRKKPLDFPSSLKDYEEKVMDVLSQRDANADDDYDLYMSFLEISTSDFDYLNASSELIQSGYKKGTDPTVIGTIFIKTLLATPVKGEQPATTLRRMALQV